MSDDDRVEITVDLREESLKQLLEGGDYVLRMWLERREDGRYTLHAAVPGDSSMEALVRILNGSHADQPPAPEPPQEVADLMVTWRDYLIREDLISESASA